MEIEKMRKYIERNAGGVFKALYFFVIGHLLLLTSAIYEHGQTEFSRSLVPKTYMIQEMIDSVVAAMLVLTAGWLFITYLIEKEKAKK